MSSKATRRFWKLYQELPEFIQRLAVKNYQLWRDNPRHPSLDFKKLVGSGERFSIRVGDHYRALGHKISDGYEWVWIGVARGLQQTRAMTRLVIQNGLCDVGVCLMCVIPVKAGDSWEYQRTCTEGPVFDSRSILWETAK